MGETKGTKSYSSLAGANMARWQNAKKPPSGPDEWQEAGAEAILDLLSQRWVVPWAEVEARIANRKEGWNGFPQVQALPLTAARRALVEGGTIIAEATAHSTPVATVRLPFPERRVRELARLRGARRKEYRRFLAWAEDYSSCGKQAERIVLDTAKSVASEAGLFVPPQAVGRIDKVAGAPVAGTFDVTADVLHLGSVSRAASLVFEVKNVHHMIYPWMPEVWELLVRAAHLAPLVPTIPVLVCVRAAWPNWQMAQDLGFFQVQLARQVFSPDIDPDEFAEVTSEFGLVAERFDGPDEHVRNFLVATMRRHPPISPPQDEDIDFWERQLDRFKAVAPVILEFAALAGHLNDDSRAKVFAAFKAKVRASMMWPQARGW